MVLGIKLYCLQLRAGLCFSWRLLSTPQETMLSLISPGSTLPRTPTCPLIWLRAERISVTHPCGFVLPPTHQARGSSLQNDSRTNAALAASPHPSLALLWPLDMAGLWAESLFPILFLQTFWLKL